MTFTALMAALICVAGPLSVSIGPIPLTLATFAVYLAAAVLGSKHGTLAVALYLLIGLVGLPVFSGFSGGFQKRGGVTGGYLIGYLPGSWIGGMGVKPGQAAPGSRWRLPLFLALGTLAIYVLGTAWFVIQTGNGLVAALSLCVLPFLPGDAIKIGAAIFGLSPVVTLAIALAAVGVYATLGGFTGSIWADASWRSFIFRDTHRGASRFWISRTAA